MTCKFLEQGKLKWDLKLFLLSSWRGKYCLKYTWRANSLPPLTPPSLQNIETIKRATLLIWRLQRWFLRRDWRTEPKAKRRALPRPCTVSAGKTLGKTEDIEVKASSVFIDRDHCKKLRKQINHVPHWKGYFRRYASTIPGYWDWSCFAYVFILSALTHFTIFIRGLSILLFSFIFLYWQEKSTLLK